MASVFTYHVVGDLTVGKRELAEFVETDTVESAIAATGEYMEGGIAVWKRRSLPGNGFESSQMRQQRFVGILDSLDIVAFLARSECPQDQEKAMKTPVAKVVTPNSSLLRVVDPGTRLIDALEMMKRGVKRLLVPKSNVWKGVSKRFSILYNGKWLKNIDASYSSNNLIANSNPPSSSSSSTVCQKFCRLSREDIIRFLIGCLGALAPLPLSSISSLGAIDHNYYSIDASSPAIEVIGRTPEDPRALAVVEESLDGELKIIGEISASKLWKCDYIAAAWALASLSAGQFVMGVEDNVNSRSLPDFQVDSKVGTSNDTVNGGGSNGARNFSSRSIGFFSKTPRFGAKSMYGGRNAPLTCKVTSSLAAVMAQMLSHRASHVWVTESESEDALVGVVSYVDILTAVTRLPPPSIRPSQSTEGFRVELQS